jgi:hypothetical protein
MSYAQILEEFKKQLELVPGIGKVHDTLRWAKDYSRIVELYRKDGRLNAWEITREGVEERPVALPNKYEARHRLVVTGYYALKEGTEEGESEKQFQDLIEAVLARFRPLPNLNNKATLLLPGNARVIGHKRFVNVLVHWTEIEFLIREWVTAA